MKRRNNLRNTRAIMNSRKENKRKNNEQQTTNTTNTTNTINTTNTTNQHKPAQTSTNQHKPAQTNQHKPAQKQPQTSTIFVGPLRSSRNRDSQETILPTNLLQHPLQCKEVQWKLGKTHHTQVPKTTHPTTKHKPTNNKRTFKKLLLQLNIFLDRSC